MSALTETPVTFTTSKCESMIKWILLQLATNVEIDHRNYVRKNTKSSKLVEFVQSCNDSFDQGIQLLANLICEDPDIKTKLQTLQELHSNPDESDDICDEIYNLEIELFSRFIELSGLYEIESLHGDSADNMRGHLVDLVYSH